jgi:hypothetical protein
MALPGAVTVVPVLQLHLMAGLPATCGSLLCCTTFLMLVSCCCSLFSPAPSVLHVCCHFVSPLYCPLVFTSCFSFFPPFFYFLLFHIGSSSSRPVLHRHFSPAPLYCSSLPTHYISHLNISVKKLFTVLNSFPS